MYRVPCQSNDIRCLSEIQSHWNRSIRLELVLQVSIRLLLINCFYHCFYRVHCQLIKVFARGPESPESEELSQQCCLCQTHKSDPYEIYSTQDNDVIIADEMK